MTATYGNLRQLTATYGNLRQRTATSGRPWAQTRPPAHARARAHVCKVPPGAGARKRVPAMSGTSPFLCFIARGGPRRGALGLPLRDYHRDYHSVERGPGVNMWGGARFARPGRRAGDDCKATFRALDCRRRPPAVFVSGVRQRCSSAVFVSGVRQRCSSAVFASSSTLAAAR